MSRRIVATGIITAGLLLSGWGTASASSVSWDSNGDDVNDVFSIDDNGDGIPEAYAIDTDYDLRIDGYQIDANENYAYDGYLFDLDGDGQMETVVFDANEDGVNDVTGVRFASPSDYVNDPDGLLIFNYLYQLSASHVY